MASRARVSRRMTDSPYPYARPWNRHAASGGASVKGLGRPRPKFAVAQLAHKTNAQTAPAFLEAFVAAGPYRVEIVLTDNSVQFADLPKNRSGPSANGRRLQRSASRQTHIRRRRDSFCIRLA
jgi:hypothetical protein